MSKIVELNVDEVAEVAGGGWGWLSAIFVADEQPPEAWIFNGVKG